MSDQPSQTAGYEDGLTHQCPPDGNPIMPCCGKTPFEVSPWDRLATDPTLVTCPRDNDSNG